jgi:hypothetical protein
MAASQLSAPPKSCPALTSTQAMAVASGKRRYMAISRRHSGHEPSKYTVKQLG